MLPRNSLARIRRKQGPPVSTNPQTQSGPPGPRFSPTNNGPTDGSPRFPHPSGQPPLRHLDSRSQLNPGGPQGQFPPPRPPYGGPPQRAPPPRNVFFGRPTQPGSPSSGPPPRFPPGQGPQGPLGQPGQQQFQGTRPPQPYPQQGFPNRPPFPPPGVAPNDPRAPIRGPIQRNDSQGGGGPIGDPRLVRPNYPPDQRQQHQQQINERRAQSRQQMSVDRMADADVIQQPRPPSSASLRNEEIVRPKSAVSDSSKSSDNESSDNKKTNEQEVNNVDLAIKSKNDSLEQQNNAKNATEMEKETSIKDSPGKNAIENRKILDNEPTMTKAEEPKPRAPSVTEKPKEMPPPSAEVLATPKTEEIVPQSREIKEPSSPQASPKTPDNTSIKGFDNGRRRSLSSGKSSAHQSPKSIASPVPSITNDDQETTIAKKKTSFADQEIIEATNDETLTSERKIESARTSKEKNESRTMKKSLSARSIKKDAENDSGVDESTQRREAPKSNGLSGSPTKKSLETDKRSTTSSPVKSPSKSIKSLPRTPEAAPLTTAEKKKVPMNKVQVGAAPSPNLKSVRSKIGSLDNATYKPGGGKVKIENRKLDFSKAQPKIAAKNDKYTPSGGDKKIQQVKLNWNAKPKIGSLENAAYKPGGGDKKIETVKLDFKEKAKPKVGSKENAKHVPGGGTVKSATTPPKTPQDNADNIETQKLDIKAESKVGSMDNMKHKPGGGDKKIFDDKTYLRQTSSNVGSVSGSGSQSPIPSGAGSIVGDKNGLPVSDENLNQEC